MMNLTADMVVIDEIGHWQYTPRAPHVSHRPFVQCCNTRACVFDDVIEIFRV